MDIVLRVSISFTTNACLEDCSTLKHHTTTYQQVCDELGDLMSESMRHVVPSIVLVCEDVSDPALQLPGTQGIVGMHQHGVRRQETLKEPGDPSHGTVVTEALPAGYGIIGMSTGSRYVCH